MICPRQAGPGLEPLRHLIAPPSAGAGMQAQVMLAGGPCWMEINADLAMMPVARFLSAIGARRGNDSQIRREQELARARDDAETANRAKSQFLAMMTHGSALP